MVTIRFDASLNRNMPWAFDAPEAPMDVKVGESNLAFYQARNLTDETITGTATYNVSPAKAGMYFSKIDCFCFTEQVLEPGASVFMPVSFFVNPEILTDSEMDDVKTITLSYTFFRAQQETSAKASIPKG
jgi:cytochrome c oxidase assembly protein subunit 11